MMASKQKIREEMKYRREKMKPEQARILGERIQNCFLQSEIFAQCELLASYIAMPKEVPTGKIHQACHNRGQPLAVPAALEHSQSYRFVRLERESALIEGPYAIPQPENTETIPFEAIDVVLVPGLAFAENGVRLGHGSGIYDRLLEKLDAISVGLAFSWQCVPELPTDEHDAHLDYVATETGFFETVAESSVNTETKKNGRISREMIKWTMK